MNQQDRLLNSIAATIADYRQQEEILKIDSEHVSEWINQFDSAVQIPILAETDHVLKHSYISRNAVVNFLTELVSDEGIVGTKPEEFWKTIGVLNIQRAGASQRELVDVLGQALENSIGVPLTDCKASSGTFIYIDDGLYTGTRLINDMKFWLASEEAPAKVKLHVIVIVLYSGGVYRVRKEIESLAKQAGKTVDVDFWCVKEFENKKSSLYRADTFAPSLIPSDADVINYCNALESSGYPPLLRTGKEVGAASIFSSHEARVLIESEFLKKGVAIRKQSPNLPDALRPLGFTGLKMLGFGAATVTYRNCPNNCPLVFWVGHPWYPLLPRKTNTQTAAFR